MTSETVHAIYSAYGRGVCADSKLYRDCRKAQYITLVLFGPTLVIRPIRLAKRDRRAWVVSAVPPNISRFSSTGYDDPPPPVPVRAFGPQVNNPVGTFNNVHIVFNNDNGMPSGD